MAQAQQGPLAGLRVVELASILAGPITGQFLAELGAQVIKVENPATGGDPTRGWRLPTESTEGSMSAYFSCANWGKRSIALDLTRPEGLALVRRLLTQADLVISSFKPGDDKKLGLDAASLHALNPALIIAQISAYGSADPRPGFDAIIQAESGFTYLNGDADGPPVKMPVALVDLLAAHQLKQAILLALLARHQGKTRGQVLQVSLLDAALASLANQASNYLVAGVVPQRMGSEHPNIVPYGSIFSSADGRALVLAVGTDRQWQQLAQALGDAELAADPRYARNADRVRQRQVLSERLQTLFASFPAATLATKLTAARVPFGFVNDMAAVFAQPQAASLCLAADGLTGVRSFIAQGLPLSANLGAPPALNADGVAILQELGLDAPAQAALRASGAWPGPAG